MKNISNFYERLVFDRLWTLTRNSEETMSNAFFEDVACLALNRLPPCYVRSIIDKSTYLTDADRREMENAVDDAVNQAIAKVRSNPRHDRED